MRIGDPCFRIDGQFGPVEAIYRGNAKNKDWRRVESAGFTYVIHKSEVHPTKRAALEALLKRAQGEVKGATQALDAAKQRLGSIMYQIDKEASP